MTVLLPYPMHVLAGAGDAADGLLLDLLHGEDLQVWDGAGEPPSGDVLARVRLYVPPYLGGAPALRLAHRMPRLEVVQLLTAGYEDALVAVPPRVTLCNARGVHDDSTAELALALVLASLREIPAFVRAGDRGEWAHRPTSSLADRRVLIVGYGGVGAAVERRLIGFGVDDVMRVARRRRDDPEVATLEDLPDLLPRAEVVVLTVPLTQETTGLVDAGFLAALPDGALLVNVARGPVVDTDALLAELHAGRLRAALDVTDPEPLPAEHPLWSAPNLLVSPHVGGNSAAFLPRALRLLRAQLTRWALGEPLDHVVRAGESGETRPG